MWDAIVNPAMTQQYYFGTRVESDLAVGSQRTYTYPDGTLAATGEIISIDPPKAPRATFHPRCDEALEAEGQIREVWVLDESNGVVQLTVGYYQMKNAPSRISRAVSPTSSPG